VSVRRLGGNTMKRGRLRLRAMGFGEGSTRYRAFKNDMDRTKHLGKGTIHCKTPGIPSHTQAGSLSSG